MEFNAGSILISAVIFSTYIFIMVGGIALLRQVSWGWRLAQIAIMVSIGFSLLSEILYFISSFHHSNTNPAAPFISFLIALLGMLMTVTLLLYLSSSHAQNIAGEKQPRGFLCSLADRWLRLLPAGVTPAMSMIGLLLIFNAISVLPSLGNFHFAGQDGYTLATNLIRIFQVGALLAGVAMLVKKDTLPLAVVTLIIGVFIFLFYAVIYVVQNGTHDILQDSLYVLSSNILPLSGMSLYAAPLGYLLSRGDGSEQ